MKKLIATVVLTVMSVCLASAQNVQPAKRLESNFQVGAGLFLESGLYARYQNPGAVLRLSYGLDIRLDDRWSVMPGLGIRAQVSDIENLGALGVDLDELAYADAFLTARYHIEANRSHIVLGLGPALSYAIHQDTYYIDADPFGPLNGKVKFNRIDVGLQPSVTFQPRAHFQWGLEANVGLLNSMIQYPEYNRTGSIHLHYIALTCGWHF
ncbi:MAG: outer membrane beta-barrel protein [Bacteroidales bacterium]|nr:outer membrane beta-barrel protein [Bacteroidales bacterium]